ncbi:MAG: Gfo/Idh/MocA family protein [Armatimonadota bacterium]
MARERLRVALLGCGVMGRSLGSKLVELERAALVGVADVDAAAAAQASEQLRVPAHADPDALLSRDDVDAVIIAAPPFLHRPLAEAAAAHGKHLFVEKPLAPSSADSQAILDAADAAGVTLMVGQVLRYYPCWRYVLERVRRGDLGNPRSISVRRVGGGWGAAARGWRASRELSGGLLMEINAHEIDFLCEIGGEVERVYAEAEHFGEDGCDYPNLAFVSLRFRSGALGLLHSSMVSALGDLSGSVEGSEGTLQYRGGFSADGTITLARPGETPVETRIGSLEYDDPVRHELSLFVDAALDGTPPPVTGRHGLRNVIVAEAAYRSAREGRPVSLPAGS